MSRATAAGEVKQWEAHRQHVLMRLHFWAGCVMHVTMFSTLIAEEHNSIFMKPYESNFVRRLLRQAATIPAGTTAVRDTWTEPFQFYMNGYMGGWDSWNQSQQLWRHKLKQLNSLEAHPRDVWASFTIIHLSELLMAWSLTLVWGFYGAPVTHEEERMQLNALSFFTIVIFYNSQKVSGWKRGKQDEHVQRPAGVPLSKVSNPQIYEHI